MAEGFSPLPNKGLIILEKYTCVLQKELRQPWKLCLSLEAGGFGTLDDYYQCYSQTSFTSPAMQAHHLLNGIRMAVHRDPNSLLKFLDAMESCSLCGGVAGKIKEEYNSEFTIKANSHCTRFRPEVPINQWCCVKLDSFQLLRCVNGLYRTSGRNA